MSFVEINWRPTSRQLRQFGVAALIALPLIGWLTTGFSAITASLACVGAAMALLGWAFPPVVRPLYLVATVIAWPIGMVVGEIAMLVLYYFVMVPTGLLMRLFGVRTLDLEFDRDAETYWQEKPPPTDVESYYRQF